MTDMYSRHQPPSHRRKTPSFSSSLLDSILRSIDESNDGPLHDHNHELRFCASEPKRSNKVHVPKTIWMNEEEQKPSLQRAIMIDQWMETQSNNKPNTYVSSKTTSSKYSSDSSSSTGTETPSTYRSLPNSFTISRKAAEAVFVDDTQKACSTKVEGKFMKSTKIKAFKIYSNMKKVKQPVSPAGSRISAFILSLFASSSKKSKHEDSIQNVKSIKHDTTTTCTSFSRSCMSKKQPGGDVKRSVRFYPVIDTVILDQKSIDERGLNTMTLPKYERRRYTEKKYKSFMVNNEEDDDDEDEDDLFELEVVGGVGSQAYGQELPVFDTTDLRKIRI